MINKFIINPIKIKNYQKILDEILCLQIETEQIFVCLEIKHKIKPFFKLKEFLLFKDVFEIEQDSWLSNQRAKFYNNDGRKNVSSNEFESTLNEDRIFILQLCIEMCKD